jgi:hypothetical protein
MAVTSFGSDLADGQDDEEPDSAVSDHRDAVSRPEEQLRLRSKGRSAL